MKMRFCVLGLMLFLAPLAAEAQSKYSDYSVKLNASALQPGQTAVLALVVDIKPGLHAQSHTPIAVGDSNPIAFVVEPSPDPAIEFLSPVFPEPKIETFPG